MLLWDIFLHSHFPRSVDGVVTGEARFSYGIADSLAMVTIIGCLLFPVIVSFYA